MSNWYRWRTLIFSLVLSLIAIPTLQQAKADQPAAMEIAAPEFEGLEHWTNSKPLTIKGLRGQVVVVHFWTFG